MLNIENLCCGYGSAMVLHELDLHVNEAEVVALIGPNGAGKTSTLQCIAGHVRARSGSVLFGGKDLGPLPPQKRVLEGIALSPEGRKLFGDMTVRENLVVGGYSRPRQATARNMQRVLDLFPRLSERIDSLGRTLSGGEQQMVAIGRALMAEPKLLLIDELSLGLMPKNVDICYQALRRLREDGIAVLLVEQNLSKALEFSDRAYVLTSGRLAWSGTSEAARSRRDLVESILGHGSAEAQPQEAELAA
ncbi:ATP-binding cassette domain-containing protein [Variovorax guangxiensis]|uniref:ATP-binding cassette domain-containing protein n=1 Tax=Variovorax guangxiensis TaxID=1775474 RepID=A0A3S0ZSM8_9BURK|nr:ABC transporter ATP-binding protein [Variovorax guangxiensis]RUR71275.1 ATP-binding cassette domain-containing protein [Variovorax guangxiensis]